MSAVHHYQLDADPDIKARIEKNNDMKTKQFERTKKETPIGLTVEQEKMIAEAVETAGKINKSTKYIISNGVFEFDDFVKIRTVI